MKTRLIVDTNFKQMLTRFSDIWYRKTAKYDIQVEQYMCFLDIKTVGLLYNMAE